MRLSLVFTAALVALTPVGVGAEGPSWIFRPACYSHSPVNGQRVAQYCPEAPALTWADDTYLESGYRHITTSIQVGNTSDHTHVVQTWGQGQFIRPYGEWEYPFRAGATPYGPWGNPQGPWTLPFDSWQNPYGLGQSPNSSWPNGQQFNQQQPHGHHDQHGPAQQNGGQQHGGQQQSSAGGSGSQ
jgi:hypothetical protein